MINVKKLKEEMEKRGIAPQDLAGMMHISGRSLARRMTENENDKNSFTFCEEYFLAQKFGGGIVESARKND